MDNSPTTIPTPIRNWLTTAVDREASDLHLVAGHPPVLRVHGQLLPLEQERLSRELLEQLLPTLCPPPYSEQFEREKNADFSVEFELHGKAQRFRANYFRAGQEIGACFRVIPAKIPDFHWANFPEELAGKITSYRNGLVLVSGVTGSGKSTTLAMLVNKYNLFWRLSDHHHRGAH